MTITESDERTFQTVITSYHVQPEEDACLPTSLKNVLDSVADGRNEPRITTSLSDLMDLCGYRKGFGCEERVIASRLSAEVSTFGLTTREETNLDFDDLTAILENEHASRPIVEVSPEYFETVDEYRVQWDRENHPYSHTVIVFKVNDEEVLFHDPFETYFKRSSRVDEVPYSMSRTQFFELWRGDYEPGWTMWIEEEDQRTFDEYPTKSD